MYMSSALGLSHPVHGLSDCVLDYQIVYIDLLGKKSWVKIPPEAAQFGLSHVLFAFCIV